MSALPVAAPRSFEEHLRLERAAPFRREDRDRPAVESFRRRDDGRRRFGAAIELNREFVITPLKPRPVPAPAAALRP